MLVAIQHSALSRFLYDLYDNKNNQVGTVRWPDFAEATNARLKNPLPGILKTNIEIRWFDQLYEIKFEYLTRDWFNDIRFMLFYEETVIASADVVGSKKLLTRPTITITQPLAGHVIRKSGLFTVRYEVANEGKPVGAIAEQGGLTIKRKLSIDLPDYIDPPVQIFLFFLVNNHAYR